MKKILPVGSGPRAQIEHIFSIALAPDLLARHAALPWDSSQAVRLGGALNLNSGYLNDSTDRQGGRISDIGRLHITFLPPPPCRHYRLSDAVLVSSSPYPKRPFLASWPIDERAIQAHLNSSSLLFSFHPLPGMLCNLPSDVLLNIVKLGLDVCDVWILREVTIHRVLSKTSLNLPIFIRHAKICTISLRLVSSG